MVNSNPSLPEERVLSRAATKRIVNSLIIGSNEVYSYLLRRIKILPGHVPILPLLIMMQSAVFTTLLIKLHV